MKRNLREKILIDGILWRKDVIRNLKRNIRIEILGEKY